VASIVLSRKKWSEQLLLELAPTHGRALGALRTASAAAIATVVLLYLQLPVLAPGVYLIFLISYDAPYLTVKRTLHALLWQCAGFFLALALVVFSDNDPMVRVLGIGGFSFLSAFLLQTGKDPQVGINIGVFSVLTLTNWEVHRPPSQLVYLSFAPILTGAIAMACKVAIEYLFTHRDPERALQLEMTSRLYAIATLLSAMANDEQGLGRHKKLQAVTRLAFAGQGKMAALVTELRSRKTVRHRAHELPASLIPLLVRLVDQAASIGRAGSADLAGEWRAELTWLACRIKAFAAGKPESACLEPLADENRQDEIALLAQRLQQMEELFRLAPEQACDRSEKQIPESHWFRADAFSNRDYLVFSGKLALSATVSYVLYNALGWPGISTACLTVLIAGLSTAGASNQKLIFRLMGAVLGAGIFGLGCQIFLWPNADTLLPFLLSVFAVSYLAAWMARGAHFGYVGLQIAFSFYLVAFQETMMPRMQGGEFGQSALPVRAFGAPLAITQGRDRVIGLLLALVVMALIFHQIHPKRSVQRMRQRLADLLQHEATQIERMIAPNEASENLLREQAMRMVAEMRTHAEAIQYEFGPAAANDQLQADKIEFAITLAGSLFLHMNSLAHMHEQKLQFAAEYKLTAEHLRTLSAWTAGKNDVCPPANLAATGELPTSLAHALHCRTKLRQVCLSLDETT